MARGKLMVRLAIFVAFAAVFSLVQLDQQARLSGRMAILLPTGLGGYADARTSAANFAREPLSAEDSITALLKYRPIEARHLSLYSLWAAEADLMDSAGKALNYAATRGWRDPFVQIAVLASAVSSNEPDVAAARLEALTRTEREPQVIFRAIDVLSTDEAGREAIASRLADSPYLADQLVDYAEARPGQETLPLQLFAMEGAGSALDCERKLRLATTYLKRGMGEVKSLISDECEAMKDPGLQFHPFSDVNGPLAWTFPSVAGVSVREGMAEGMLTYNNRNLLRKLIAFRYLTLSPGSHELTIVEHDSSRRPLASGTKGEIELRITCPEGLDTDRRLVLRQPGYGIASFDVPEDCPVQHIRLFAARGRGENISLTIN
ncbi:hypothetical protein [Qipengyuania sphaerica]|uniref:hypothetical protein n=1 Tax=Qipengyuania sphaerica TaxID=2867243 RepID=UPI001C87195F|nr:hypothetical protein [Qipengyuania sphaerica]MBX7540825.1 hypothetical protein [Qipengyuania sphaerica]